MSMSFIAVIFLFLCFCLAGIAVLVKSGEFIPAGIIAVLMITGLLLFASAYTPNGQLDSLKAEIVSLKNQIETMKDIANNPAYLVGICMVGASCLVALVFFGVYGLLIIQAKIRHSERESVKAISQRQSEPVQQIPVYRDTEYQHLTYQL